MVKREGRSLQEGFTFMELAVAVAILGILATIGGFGYMRYAEMARENKTKTNLRTIKSAIDLFKIQYGKLPVHLKDLVERPKYEIKGWKPSFEEKLPTDGWSYDFVYKPTPGSKHPYELYSYGGSAGPEEAAENRISVWDL
jgi:general secretion pathway protein G